MIICILVILGELYALSENSGLLNGKYNKGFLGYYTNLSNIMVLGYFILKLFNVGTNAAIDLIIMMTILITFLVYHFVLSPAQLKEYRKGTLNWNFFGPTNMLLHYINPVLTIIYWLLFCDKTLLNYYDSLAVLLVPMLYWVYILIRRALKVPINRRGDYYPYDFMNADKFGVKKAMINGTILMLLVGCLSTLIILVIKLL